MEMNEYNREQKLSKIIQVAMQNMLSDRMANLLTKKKINTKVLTTHLIEMLHNTIRCEREQYIETMEAHINFIEMQNEEIKKEMSEQKRRFEITNGQLLKENEYLLKRVDQLEGKLKSLDWKSEVKNATASETISQKNQTINLLKKGMINLQNKIREMSIEMFKLSNAVQKMKKTEHKIFVKAHKLCNNTFSSTLTSVQHHNIQRFATILQKQINDNEHYRQACDNLLKTIWNTSKRPHPSVKAPDLPLRINDVKSFLSTAIFDQRQEAKDEIRTELSISFPELTATQENVSVAVTKLFNEKINEKETIYKEQLEQSRKREDLLKQKLETTLEQITQISKINSTAQFPSGSINHQQSQVLDEKMKNIYERIYPTGKETVFSVSDLE